MAGIMELNYSCIVAVVWAFVKSSSWTGDIRNRQAAHVIVSVPVGFHATTNDGKGKRQVIVFSHGCQ